MNIRVNIDIRYYVVNSSGPVCIGSRHRQHDLIEYCMTYYQLMSPIISPNRRQGKLPKSTWA